LSSVKERHCELSPHDAPVYTQTQNYSAVFNARFTPVRRRRNWTQPLSQAANNDAWSLHSMQRNVAMLTASLHCRLHSRRLSWVELRRQFEFTPTAQLESSWLQKILIQFFFDSPKLSGGGGFSSLPSAGLDAAGRATSIRH